MQSIPTNYDASTTENELLDYWNTKAVFKADPNSKKEKFCIVIPPPNVTGRLHMGHALVNTLQDIQIRFKKMCGLETLWVPGTDHAGIATQTVVERHFIQNENKRRKDYTREEFIKKIWDWKEEHEHIILDQLKKMGCSLDWSRKCFTMDETRSKAVFHAFKKLFDQELIYQGNYLVHWDPITQTALSDDEVEYEEKKGHLWHIKYPIYGSDEFLVIATTRPETMLGDVAVAVHPKDTRYKHLIGKKIALPLTERKIPILQDDFVDREFGTGAVKITPAHDFNDYELGARHQLKMINLLHSDGTMNENALAFEGLSITKAREKVVASLHEKKLIEKVEDHLHRVGRSYRSKAIVEPYLSKQWFLRMTPFKKRLLEMVEKEVELLPSSWKNTYRHWIENLRDWCISRQLWWGHQIPIYYNKKNPSIVICAEPDKLPNEIKNNPDQWMQDEDVLDTWFSSALWPFSTLGWPEKTVEFNSFFPNSLLVTGHDILFFWVARMLFMSDTLLEKAPFPKVFLHGLIFGKSYWQIDEGGHIQYVSSEKRKAYDLGEKVEKGVQSKWEKMSKSKGNIIDPIEIIKEYGADSMRMALASSAVQNRQIDLDRRKFEDFKHFSNKIWNGARFVLMNLFDSEKGNLTSEDLSEGINEKLLELEDKWALDKASNAATLTAKHLDNMAFEEATNLAYSFFWNEFCAYYVEIVKPTLFLKRGDSKLRKNKQKVLLCLMLQALRLLHPMAPFITEHLFQIIKKKIKATTSKEKFCMDAIDTLKQESIANSSFPKKLSEYPSETHDFVTLQQVIYLIRNVRGEMKIPPQTKVDLYCQGDTSLVQEQTHIIQTLAKVDQIHFAKPPVDLGFFSSHTLQELSVVIPLPKELAAAEKKRQEKEKEKWAQELQSINARLANDAFLQKAPEQVVAKMKERQKELTQKLKA